QLQRTADDFRLGVQFAGGQVVLRLGRTDVDLHEDLVSSVTKKPARGGLFRTARGRFLAAQACLAAFARSTASPMSCLATSAPFQSPIFTHLPGSRSL